MRIGELSQLTGASIRSLRYYEQQGLLKSDRSDSGYREYNLTAVEQVKTIRFYLSLGLTTEEISGFLTCVMKNKEAFCQEILPIYRQKMAELDAQIGLLTGIRANLAERITSILEENEGSDKS
ncbi:MerR family transcriptional regulator [Gorillibacterium timonense]|uniref:MerR family transcriptional regulator n=1 Tax=Gorillibacterium timonense TaxID=1689269 RepID=UPI00071C28FB|nr:MerR family transcriptional regulator [Gorillibacterium timonense]